jgi:shikimate 5-dehydrogenase
MPVIDGATKLFVSLSERPSSNGVYFYNGMFSRLGINAVYLSTPTRTLEHLRTSLDLFRVHGAAIAAPYKKEVIAHVDELTDSARSTSSVNSIKRLADGRWIGHNTDEVGLREMIGRYQPGFRTTPVVLVFGAGGVVPSVVSALRAMLPNSRIILQARKDEQGHMLAGQLGVESVKSKDVLSCDLFVNATPASQSNFVELLRLSEKAKVVFDLLPIQEQYAFETAVQYRGQAFIRGFEFYLAQFSEQFLFFTGIRPELTHLGALVELRSSN